MARHYVNPEIAQQLGLSVKTIGNHVTDIFNRLQVADRAAAVLRACQAGLE
jgi:DNA-binding NarL/FixJ family response regulator